MGLTGHEIEHTRRGGPEGRVEVVVTHRETLCVVPECRDGVAVVVIHHESGRRRVGCCAALDLRELGKLVHQAAVQRLLLRRVVVILVARQGVRHAEALRVHPVRVVRQQLRREAVDRRRSRLRLEGLPVSVGRIGIRAEVVIEGNILLKEHDDVLDRRRGLGAVVNTRGSAHPGDAGE